MSELVQDPAGGDTPAVEAEFDVSGMTCGSCAARVQRCRAMRACETRR